MKHFVFGVVFGFLAPSIATAQQNPFKLPKVDIPAIQVDYTYSGDMQGTSQRAMSHERMMEHQTTTGKFFGKTSTIDTWTLVTPDSSYTADLTKKTGTRAPNVLPFMARAYDDLDRVSKQRLHQNMQDMAQMISRAFGTSALWSGEKTATKTYAGEKCDEHTFGGFSVCSMQGGPSIPLHVSGSFLCVNFEQTATTVKKTEPPASTFALPSGVTFHPDPNLSNPDSLAHGFVKYLASQELADSIAKAKSQQAAARASSPGNAHTADTVSRQLTPEEQEQQRKACEALKNFNLGTAMANATQQVVSEAIHEAVEEKKQDAKQSVKDKIKGAIKKPRFP